MGTKWRARQGAAPKHDPMAVTPLALMVARAEQLALAVATMTQVETQLDVMNWALRQQPQAHTGPGLVSVLRQRLLAVAREKGYTFIIMLEGIAPGYGIKVEAVSPLVIYAVDETAVVPDSHLVVPGRIPDYRTAWTKAQEIVLRLAHVEKQKVAPALSGETVKGGLHGRTRSHVHPDR